MRKIALVTAVVLYSLVAVGWALAHFAGASLPGFDATGGLLLWLRWAGAASLVVYGGMRRSLTTWIFVCMVLGAMIGNDAPAVALNLRVLSLVFLRLIKTIIAPLLFATLVSGIAGHADLKQVGRMGVKALVYFEVITTFALAIGLGAIHLSQAGAGIHLTGAAVAVDALPTQKLTLVETVLHVFPENIAKSVAEGQVLQVVVFAVLFGIALAMVSPERRKPLLAVVESLAEVMFKFTKIVMYLAPLGAGAALAYTVASTGLGVLGNLARLLATLYAALAVFVIGVLLPVALIAGVPLRRFLKAVTEPVTIAFATANSEAALPIAMERMEEMGVPRQVVAFVMPTGYSFNLDGSTLYLALAAIFVSQAAGVHLSLGQQLLLMFTLMLTSKGVAGVSRASLVILLGTVSSFGLPVEPVFILLGIDQLMDMGRTGVNVLGNCLATVVVARWEGEFAAE